MATFISFELTDTVRVHINFSIIAEFSVASNTINVYGVGMTPIRVFTEE